MKRWAIVGLGWLTLVATTACGDGSGGGGEPVGSGYQATAVADACDLLDLSVLNMWETTVGKREHTKEENILGTVLTCDAENESAGVARMAGLLLQATVHKNRGEARSGYEMGVRFGKNASDVTSSGAVSGIGSEAFFVWTAREYDADGFLNTASAYQISVLDGALEVHLTLAVAAPITEGEAAEVAQRQARRVMEELKG